MGLPIATTQFDGACAMRNLVKVGVCLLVSIGVCGSGFADTCPEVCGLPQTGQSECSDVAGATIPCGGTGQDGAYKAGVSISPRFTVNGDGTVTDNLTNLIWLHDSDCFGNRYWQTALDDANGLASGDCGLTDGSVAGDWRLPNARELQSLTDYGEVNPALPADQPFFNTTGLRWASTTRVEDPEYAILMHLDDGWLSTFVSKLTDVGAVWPVRGGLEDCSAGGLCGVAKTGQSDCWNSFGMPIPCAGTGQDGEYQAGVEVYPRFMYNGDGTVTDQLTGLTWLIMFRCLYAQWPDALDWANNLSNGDCELSDGSVPGDWRLPNINELFSLVDFGEFNPALPPNHPFESAVGHFATSYSSTSSGSGAWDVGLSTGYITRLPKSFGSPLWAVKGGFCEGPTRIAEIFLSKTSPTDIELTWDAFDDADSWDVLGGSLTDLHLSNGNFAEATNRCLSDGQSATTCRLPRSEPGPSEFYLVRPSNCGLNGSVNSDGPWQIEGRDLEVGFSGVCN